MGTTPLYYRGGDESPVTGERRVTPVLLAESRDSTGSSRPADSNRTDETYEGEPEPIALGLAIRRTRLLGCTAAALAFILGCTLWFHHGIAISHFDSSTKNSTEQTKLLNDYNSYTGNIATVFAKPIELFVTIAVQVIVLRFLSNIYTRPESSWRLSGLTLLLGAGVGYMISNGFNALNVQLRPQKTHSRVSAVDLGLDKVARELTDTFASAFSRSTPELSPKNPANNTILRTVLVQQTPMGTSVCGFSSVRDGVSISNGTVDEVEPTYLNLGFPQREWQNRILQEDLPTDSLRVVVNPTNASINRAVNSSALPMNASLAALLFDFAVKVGAFSFPWASRGSYVNRTDIVRRYPVKDAGTYNISDTLPKIFGLVPNDAKSANNETAQKAFFIPAVLAAATRYFAGATRTKTSDIGMVFTHTQIAPSITYDAVTLEVEIDPLLLATFTTADNRTRYTVLDQINNCPGSSNCLVQKPSYKMVKPMYDPPAQISAYRTCTDANGMETTRVNVTIRNNTVVAYTGNCSERDDAIQPAIYVVSIGKRLVADALQQNVSVSENGTLVQRSDSATVTNLRKIYTLTVGRLGWEYKDLAREFNAACTVGEPNCRGLELPLAKPINSATTVSSGLAQRLVVGQGAVTYAQTLLPPVTVRKNYRMTLVSLAEPPEITEASRFYEIMAGDLLLPHNVGKTTWDVKYAHPQCDVEAERRVMMMRSKHHYMEYSIQAGYASAMYYLFQYAVVRDMIPLTATRQSLAFQNNSVDIALWVSTPKQNMRLTIIGCIVLVAGLIGVVVKSTAKPKENDALNNITQPQAIARVMMDERRYPPLFLHRVVVEKEGVARVNEFSIAGLSLQQQQEQQRRRRLGRAESSLKEKEQPTSHRSGRAHTLAGAESSAQEQQEPPLGQRAGRALTLGRADSVGRGRLGRAEVLRRDQSQEDTNGSRQ